MRAEMSQVQKVNIKSDKKSSLPTRCFTKSPIEIFEKVVPAARNEHEMSGWQPKFEVNS